MGFCSRGAFGRLEQLERVAVRIADVDREAIGTRSQLALEDDTGPLQARVEGGDVPDREGKVVHLGLLARAAHGNAESLARGDEWPPVRQGFCTRSLGEAQQVEVEA